MYGNVTRKIITNNASAWSLAGIAKRLSFAIDNMNLPIANLVVDAPGGGRVSVFRHGSMEIWDLRSGGQTYFRLKIIKDGSTEPLGDEDGPGGVSGTSASLRNVQEINIWAKESESFPWYDSFVYFNAYYDQSYYKQNLDGSTSGRVYNAPWWEFDSPWWNSGYPTHPNKMPYMENGVHHAAETYDGAGYVALQKDGYYIRVEAKDSIPVYYKPGTSGIFARTTIGPLGTSGHDGTDGTFWPKILVPYPQDVTIQVPLWKLGGITYVPPATGTSGTAAFPLHTKTEDVICKFTVTSSLAYNVNQIGFNGYTTAGIPYQGTTGTRGGQVCMPTQLRVYFPEDALASDITPSISGSISFTITYSDGQSQTISTFDSLQAWDYSGGGYYVPLAYVTIQPRDLALYTGGTSGPGMEGMEVSMTVGTTTGSVTLVGEVAGAPVSKTFTCSGFLFFVANPLFAWIDTPVIH